MDTILVKDLNNRVTVSVAEKGATGPQGPQGPQGQAANLVPATNSTIGGIIVGDNLSITGNGVLSAQPGGVTAFNNRTGNVSLLANDVTTLVNANYLQVYKDTQANESTLTQFGLSSFIQSGSLGSGYSRGLLTSNVSGTTTRSIFDGNVYQSSATARYPAYKRIAFNSNNTSGANSTGRIQVNDYGAVFIDSQTSTSGSNISRVSAFSAGSATSFQNSGDILLTSPGVNFYAYKSNNDGSNVGAEQGSFGVSEMQRGVSGPNGTYISRPYTVSFESRNTWPVADTTISYSYTPNYRTFMTIGDSAELFFQNYGNLTTRNPTWTSNSILTQGYADSRYAAIGSYLTSANMTFANLTGTPTTLAGYGITDGLTSANLTPYLTISSANATYSVLGHTHSIANVTGLQTALDLKLPSANFTYANITGTPDLTAYVKKTQNTTQTIASTASIGSDSSTLTLNSSSYGMSVTTLAGTSNLTVTPTTATLVLAGGGTWTANSILTLGYADGRYLTTANLTYANITGKPTLANVATSGSYTDLSNTPASYSLPTASTTVLGGVKVDGTTITIASGVISASASSYSLPTATTSVLGGVKVDGSTITISSGVISAVSSSYTLPMATTSTLGGVRIGSGISVDQGNGFLNTDVRLTTNTFTGTQNLGGNLITQPKLQAYRETSTAPTISTGTLALDLSGSNFFAVSLNAAITTLTISNTPSSSAASFTLEFTADGTARAVTWGSAIKWAGGTAPTLTSTSGKKDVFAFYSNDGGTTWQGFIGGQNY